MLDIFIHHYDYFSIYSYTAQAKAWLQQTGRVPLWHTTMAGGLAYVSNGPLALSFNRIFAYLGTSVQLATALVEWLCLAGSAIGMFALLRVYGIGRGGAFAAAVLYQYFAATWWGLECYPSALAVFSLLLCELYERSRRPALLFANALLVAVFTTTAIPHGILIIFSFQAVFAVARLIDGTGKGFAAATFGSWLPGLLMAMPALLPTARDAGLSYRLYFIRPIIDFGSMTPLEQVWNVLNVGFQLSNLGPGLLVAAALGLPAILFIRDRLLRTLFFVYLACELCLGVLTLNQGLTVAIPVIGRLLNAFDLQRNFLLPFMAAFFAGVTIDALLAGSDKALRPALLRKMLALLGLLLALWLIGGNRFREYSIAAAAGVGGFVWLSLRGETAALQRWAPRFLVGLCVFCAFILAQSHVKDMLRLANKLKLPAVASAFSDVAMRARVDKDLGESGQNARQLVETLRESTAREHTRAMDVDVLGFSGKSFYAVHDIPTLFYFDNTSPARSREYFMWMVDDIRTTNPVRYGHLWHSSSFYGADGSRFNTAMLSLAGVKWILEPKDMPETRFTRVWTGDRVALYRNDEAFPKAFAVFGMEVLPDKDAMAKRLMSASVQDLRRAVLVRPEDAPSLPEGYFGGGEQRAEVRVASYTPDEVLVDVDAGADCLLVLGDTNHPVWKASVDGRPVAISPAYNMFRMVPVPKGSHQVRFYVEDNLFRLGLGIMAGVLALLTAWLVLAERRWRRAGQRG